MSKRVKIMVLLVMALLVLVPDNVLWYRYVTDGNLVVRNALHLPSLIVILCTYFYLQGKRQRLNAIIIIALLVLFTLPKIVYIFYPFM